MALKDKLMTLEDFKAVRDVDVASNSAQFTEIKADLADVTGTREIQWVEGSYISLVSEGSTVSITPIANTSMAHVIVQCKKGDRITFTLTPGSIGAMRTSGFFDTSYVCVQRNATTESLYNVTLIAPIDGYFIANANVNNTHKLYIGITDTSGFTNNLTSNIENIYSFIGTSTELNYTIESNKVYPESTPSGKTLNNYNTYTYEVTSGDIISINTSLPSALGYKLAMMYNANNEFIGYIERDTEVGTQSKIITIPPNCSLIRISVSSSVTPFVNKLTISANKYVRITGDTVTIKNDNSIITMKKRGNNNLFDFHSIANSENVVLLTAGSDWQGPYVVSSINNADGDAISTGSEYTGGNHAYGDRGNSGTPTARTAEIHVYADGNEITSDNVIEWHDYVDVIWVNYVQAWNTKKVDGTGREVIKENPKWRFYPDGRVETSNFITALEDITVSMYYGLQTQGAWAEKGIYLPSASREYISMSDFTQDGLGTKFSGYEVSAVGNSMTIKMGFDGTIDLGTGSGITSQELREKRIHTSTIKMYIYMMYEFTLHSNEHAEYKGYYKFIMT